MTLKTGIIKITARYLNDVNDAIPGASVAGYTGQPPQYAGQVGAVMELNSGEASKLSDTAVATLYEGLYQYVQLATPLTQATGVGVPVYWSNPDTHLVTTDHLASNGSFAGVLINAVTAGNYGFIQTAGKASCKTIGSITKGTPAAGDCLAIKAATDGGFDVPADNTTFNPNIAARQYVGEWISVVTTGATVYLAWLKNVCNSAGFFN